MNKKSIIFLLCFVTLQTIGIAQNLIINGDFEDNFTSWSFYENGNINQTFSMETTDTNSFLVVNTAEISENSTVVAIESEAFLLQTNSVYMLSFYAKTNDNTKNNHIKSIFSNQSIFEKIYNVTTDWSLNTFYFTTSDTILQLKFEFSHNSIFHIDNISIVEYAELSNLININTEKTFQAFEGFGAAIAFYENWVAQHPYKEDIYKVAFTDLGIDWLRIKNSYRYQRNFNPEGAEFARKAKEYSDNEIKILMSSWSPPPHLKNNNSENRGTLKKVNEQFVYDDFANYWRDALLKYDQLGVNPDWISIQNEPDWLSDWETCKFTPKETSEFAGYNIALESVNEKIKFLENKPKLLGAEALGIGYNNFNNYQQPIKDKSYLHGHSYHLYHGGDPNNPDTFIPYLQNISSNFDNKPNYMTEFEHKDAGWLKSAWLISNVLNYANVSAYFYWDLIWPDAGLIDIQSPWNRAEWKNDKGFVLNPMYYMFKHFSKHIQSNYIRLETSSNLDDIKLSAFISNNSDSIKIVLINTSETEVSNILEYPNNNYELSYIILSVENDMYKTISTETSNLTLPPNSIATLTYSQKPIINCNGEIGANYFTNNCNQCTDSTQNSTSCNTFEVEKSCDYAGKISSNIPNYSGTGFFQFDNSDSSYFSVFVEAETQGIVELHIKYINNSDSNIECDIYINNQLAVENHTFNTKNNNTWEHSMAEVFFQDGINSISIVSNTSSNKLYIDAIGSTSNIKQIDCAKQLIELEEGWNLISTNVEPLNKRIASIFEGIEIDAIKDEENHYLLRNPESLNVLDSIITGKVYLVYSNSNTQFTITGTSLNSETYNYNIVEGWNMVGCIYPYITPISETVFDTDFETIKNFDGFWQKDYNINSLFFIEPGKGYFLKK